MTVVDRLDAPGGRAYVFRQDGFTFDAGPTIVTAPFLFEELWEMCGKTLSDDVELRRLDPVLQDPIFGRRVADLRVDNDAMRAQIRLSAPGDVKGFDRFLKESEEIFRIGF